MQAAAGVRHRVLAARVLRPRAGAQPPLPQLLRRHERRSEQHGPVPSHAGALRASGAARKTEMNRDVVCMMCKYITVFAHHTECICASYILHLSIHT